jgi:hypothetical protein
MYLEQAQPSLTVWGYHLDIVFRCHDATIDSPEFIELSQIPEIQGEEFRIHTTPPLYLIKTGQYRLDHFQDQ